MVFQGKVSIRYSVNPLVHLPHGFLYSCFWEESVFTEQVLVSVGTVVGRRRTVEGDKSPVRVDFAVVV